MYFSAAANTSGRLRRSQRILVAGHVGNSAIWPVTASTVFASNASASSAHSCVERSSIQEMAGISGRMSAPSTPSDSA